VVVQDGSTLLHLACRSGFLDLLNWCISNNADTNAVDNVQLFFDGILVVSSKPEMMLCIGPSNSTSYCVY
jgi:ankyrin repeat protein